MPFRIVAVLVPLTSTAVFGGVFSYEAWVHPLSDGWSDVGSWCSPQEWNDEGWLFQQLEICPGYDPPNGQQAAYNRSVADFIGSATFFVEWRVESTANSNELPWGGGSTLAAGSNAGVNYKCQVTRTEVEIWRDNTLPIIFVPIEPGIPHTYRVEMVGTERYTWFIDGQIVDSGIPEGPYPPTLNPNVTWRSKPYWVASTSRWAYIRYGNIPQPNSGDFDSNGAVDESDLYFFVDCLLGPDYDAAGPGCKWADMNADGVANGADVPAFVTAIMS